MNSNNSPCTSTEPWQGPEDWGRPRTGAAQKVCKCGVHSSARKTAHGEEAGADAGVEIMTLGNQYTRTIGEILHCQRARPVLACPALTRMMGSPVCD